jgi:hypothetical protein
MRRRIIQVERYLYSAPTIPLLRMTKNKYPNLESLAPKHPGLSMMLDNVRSHFIFYGKMLLPYLLRSIYSHIFQVSRINWGRGINDGSFTHG